MNKLTAKQLLMINQKLTNNNHGASAALMKSLDEISKMPYIQNEAQFYVYRNTVAKASKLGCSIAQIRPFEKKNTQTAVLALLTLLELNGEKLSGYEDDIPGLVSLLCSGNEDGVRSWITRYKSDEGYIIE